MTRTRCQADLRIICPSLNDLSPRGIESVGQATTWGEFQDLLLESRGRVWRNRHKDELQALRRAWSWRRAEQRTFLLLGEPRLVFNPPVRKERLQKGRGWLSKRFFSFDDLFAAWKK